jgi:hypothetical protein
MSGKFSDQPDKATPASGDLFPLVDVAAPATLKKITWANLVAAMMGTFAAVSTTVASIVRRATATEVTNGSAVDAFVAPNDLATELAKRVPHSLTTAANDVLVGSATPGSWIKKTLAEFKTILGLGSAAFVNTGGGAGQVPTADMLGAAAYLAPGISVGNLAQVQTGGKLDPSLVPPSTEPFTQGLIGMGCFFTELVNKTINHVYYSCGSASLAYDDNIPVGSLDPNAIVTAMSANGYSAAAMMGTWPGVSWRPYPGCCDGANSVCTGLQQVTDVTKLRVTAGTAQVGNVSINLPSDLLKLWKNAWAAGNNAGGWDGDTSGFTFASAAITSRARTSNVATIILNRTPAGFIPLVGKSITLSGVGGSGYNGTFVITAANVDYVTGKVYVTYASAGTNEATTADASGLATYSDTTLPGGWYYYIHAIRNPTTGVSDVLIGTSPTAPVLPSGFTVSRVIGRFFVEPGATPAINLMSIVSANSAYKQGEVVSYKRYMEKAPWSRFCEVEVYASGISQTAMGYLKVRLFDAAISGLLLINNTASDMEFGSLVRLNTTSNIPSYRLSGAQQVLTWARGITYIGSSTTENVANPRPNPMGLDPWNGPISINNTAWGSGVIGNGCASAFIGGAVIYTPCM